MNVTPTLLGCALGLGLGVRHAFEPDHLAAVSTLVADGRKPATAAKLGAWWGLGHTLAMLAVGSVVFALRRELSATASAVAELAVASTLIVLGARNLSAPFWHARDHAAGDKVAPPRRVALAGWKLARRPLTVGMIHGVAGSGALTALALAGMPTAGAALLFVGIFGLGSVAGMALASALVGFSMDRLVGASRARSHLLYATGGLSLALGLTWSWLALEQLAR